MTKVPTEFDAFDRKLNNNILGYTGSTQLLGLALPHWPEAISNYWTLGFLRDIRRKDVSSSEVSRVLHQFSWGIEVHLHAC